MVLIQIPMAQVQGLPVLLTGGWTSAASRASLVPPGMAPASGISWSLYGPVPLDGSSSAPGHSSLDALYRFQGLVVKHLIAADDA